jgi:quinol monooxygenase YgiN
MIVINARLAANAASIEQLKDAISVMERASRAEPGCRDYAFSVELNDPTTLRITELWDDMDALAAHFATPHMAEFGKALQAHPPKSLDVHCFDASEVPLPGR